MAPAGRNIGRLKSKKRQFTNFWDGWNINLKDSAWSSIRKFHKQLKNLFFTMSKLVSTGHIFCIALAEESHFWRASISYFKGNPQELTLLKGKIVNLFYSVSCWGFPLGKAHVQEMLARQKCMPYALRCLPWGQAIYPSPLQYLDHTPRPPIHYNLFLKLTYCLKEWKPEILSKIQAIPHDWEMGRNEVK